MPLHWNVILNIAVLKFNVIFGQARIQKKISGEVHRKFNIISI